VWVNGKQQTVNLLEPRSFSLNIQKAISGIDANRIGESTANSRKPLITTRAASACYYAIIPAKNLKKGDRIEITGRNIKVNYIVK
jgi:hypothetical protein